MDRVLAELAAVQHGVVGLAQLRDLGVSRDAVQLRARTGHLHRTYRGVYAVGHAKLTQEGWWKAAELASGPEAALGHRSAAARLGMTKPPAGAIHTITWSCSGRTDRRRAADGVPGLVIHRAPTLTEDDVVVVDGTRCTTVARTIVDVAASATRRQLERLLDEAAHLEILSVRAIGDVAGRIARPRGIRMLREVLAEHAAGSTRTQSALEERFIELCRRADLRMPRTQVPVALGEGRYAYLDAFFADEAVAVELDGPDHARASRARYDAWRDRRLAERGILVLRFTEEDLYERPDMVVRTVRAALLARRVPVSAA